jgi:hypothetical protein
MQNLAVSLPDAEEGEHGCGRPDCGQTNGGGCSSCGSGGCSIGGCGQGARREEVGAYLAGLRSRIDQRARTSLL